MPTEVPLPEIPPKPRLSVIIVSRNCEQALRRCLASLEASKDRAHFEVFVVDAGSWDGCPRMDTEFSSITVLRLPRNFGRARLRNIAIRSATSDIVLFLDPHTELRPDTLSELATFIESSEGAVAAVPALEDPSGNPVEFAHAFPSAADLAAACLRSQALPRRTAESGPVLAVDDLALAIRRSFLQGMNYFDERRFSEHWGFLEVAWQVRNAGRQILVAESARAVLHPLPGSPEDETLDASDRIAGAACYIAKHAGIFAGISFRIKSFLSALGSGRLGLALAILSSRRIDGT